MGLLNNAISAAVGTAATTVYTTPANKNGILIGGNIANIVDEIIYVDIVLKRGGTSIHILKGLVIPPNTSFSFSGQEQKLVLSPTDEVVVTSSIAASADVWLSLSEMDGEVSNYKMEA